MSINLSPKTQRIVSALWPLALIAMVIVMPFAVKKAYDEMKVNDR